MTRNPVEELIETIPTGIVLLEEDTGIVRRINKTGASIIGEEQESLIGRKCPDCLNFSGNEQTQGEEKQLKRQDGRHLTVLRTSSRISYGDSSLLIVSFLDITLRKQLEKETKEEMEKALQKTEMYAKKAEDANRSKSGFLASMSHEIRTPLNGIIGFLTLLEETELSREQRDFCANAVKSSRILLSLLNDILDFSKIEAGKLDIEKISFNLHEAAEETVITFAVSAEEKGNELIFRIGPDVPVYCKGDPNRFKQILMNLCSNAIKFTRDGDIEISVSVREETEKKIQIQVDVADEGIGIAKDKLKTIFTSFSQAGSSVAREYGGSGLGLTIAKQLTTMLGGELWVESTEGTGSVFSFYINFDRSTEQPNPEETHDLDKKAVLVIGNKEKSISVVKQYLKEWGMEVTAAHGVSETEKELAGGMYSFIFIDTTLGWIPSQTVLQELRSRRGDDCQLIILASPGKIAMLRTLENENDIHIVAKPLRKNDLRDELLRINRDRPQTGPAQTSALIPSEERDEKSRPHKTEKILIAEDNTINLKLTGKILEKNGYPFDAAKNGKEALDMWKKGPYSCILMDCMMPEMDGYLATLKIRQIEKKNGSGRIPIIALTANAMKGERQKVLSAGMDDYLSKPVKPEEMITIIEKWLNR